MQIRTLTNLFMTLLLSACAVSPTVYQWDPEVIKSPQMIHANVFVESNHRMDEEVAQIWRDWMNPEENIRSWAAAIEKASKEDMVRSGIFSTIVPEPEESDFIVSIHTRESTPASGGIDMKVDMSVIDPATGKTAIELSRKLHLGGGFEIGDSLRSGLSRSLAEMRAELAAILGQGDAATIVRKIVSPSVAHPKPDRNRASLPASRSAHSTFNLKHYIESGMFDSQSGERPGGDATVSRAQLAQVIMLLVKSWGADMRLYGQMARFKDIGVDHPAYGAIQFCVSHGILQGFNEMFHGDKRLNRYQMSVVLKKIYDRFDPSAKRSFPPHPFTDVGDTHWAAHAIRMAAGRGIMQGYEGGREFGGDKLVTWAQLEAMVARMERPRTIAAEQRSGQRPSTHRQPIAYPHGHTKHVCTRSCPYYASRYPHGHRMHICNDACKFYNPNPKPRSRWDPDSGSWVQE